MELAVGQGESCSSNAVDSGKCLSPAEALGQSGGSWFFFVKIMLTMICVIVGCGLLWMRRQRIQAQRQLENEVQQGGAADFEGDGSEAGETDSQKRSRYFNSQMCEVSDPELWQRINHGNGSESDSDVSMTSDQPHDPYAATVLEAIHRGGDTISNLTICDWLLGRCTRRLNDARERESRLFYTDAVHSLRDGFMLMCTGERDVPHGRLREMLREFARLSPRDDSPTSRLTVQQVYDELMEVERRQRVHDGLDEDEPMPEADQQVDNADQLVYEGPQTLEQSVNRDIESIRATRMRMINELHERIAVAEAYSDQELIWQLEEQLDWWINAI